MSKFATAQNNFSSGELSPKLNGSFDLQEYFNGVYQLRNFITSKVRGAFKRPGTRYQFDAGGVGEGSIPFIFSRLEVYYIVLAKSISSIGIVYDVLGNQIDILPRPLPLYWGNDEYKTTDFNYCQSGDVLFLTHRSGDLPPIIIKRLSQNEFTATLLTDNSIANDCLSVPYLDQNLDTEILLASNTTGAAGSSGVIDAENSSTNPIPFFHPTYHIGSYFRISDGSTEGVCKITSSTTRDVEFDASEVEASNPDEVDIGTAHGMTTGDKVKVSTTDTVPGGLAEDTDYYLIVTGANTYKFATS